MKKTIVIIALLGLFLIDIYCQNYILKENIFYILSGDSYEYRKERCILDIYYSEAITDYQTIIWFYGSRLVGGKKGIPNELKSIVKEFLLEMKVENFSYKVFLFL